MVQEDKSLWANPVGLLHYPGLISPHSNWQYPDHKPEAEACDWPSLAGLSGSLGCREGSPRLSTDLLGILQVIEPFIFLHVIKVVSIKTAQV